VFALVPPGFATGRVDDVLHAAIEERAPIHILSREAPTHARDLRTLHDGFAHGPQVAALQLFAVVRRDVAELEDLPSDGQSHHVNHVHGKSIVTTRHRFVTSAREGW
jgi:hypothetical protein